MKSNMFLSFTLYESLVIVKFENKSITYSWWKDFYLEKINIPSSQFTAKSAFMLQASAEKYQIYSRIRHARLGCGR